MSSEVVSGIDIVQDMPTVCTVVPWIDFLLGRLVLATVCDVQQTDIP